MSALIKDVCHSHWTLLRKPVNGSNHGTAQTIPIGILLLHRTETKRKNVFFRSIHNLIKKLSQNGIELKTSGLGCLKNVQKHEHLGKKNILRANGEKDFKVRNSVFKLENVNFFCLNLKTFSFYSFLFCCSYARFIFHHCNLLLKAY